MQSSSTWAITGGPRDTYRYISADACHERSQTRRRNAGQSRLTLRDVIDRDYASRMIVRVVARWARAMDSAS